MSASVSITPRAIPDGPAPAFPFKVADRWTQFLGSIRSGLHVADAMKKHYMTRADIEACCQDDTQRQAYDQAKLVALRRQWSLLDLEAIFDEIRVGTKAVQALEKVKPSASYSMFLRLVSEDPVLTEQYRRALRAAALVKQDELIDLADDKSGDVLEQVKGPVGNTANVQRSKLMVDTRYRLMASWDKRMFGEDRGSVAVQVNVNHAAQLEEARARARSHQPSRPAAIDAVFQEVMPIDTRAPIAQESASVASPPSADPLADQGAPLDTAWLYEA